MKYRVLIAIKTCHKYRQRADAQRRTWIPDVEGCDLKFFLGRKEGYQPLADEILLDVDDGYLALPDKTIAICKWALAQGYDYIFQCDDDVYLRPDRLLTSGFENHDYIGRLRGPSGQWPAPYCSGFSYWLSANSMRAIVRTKWNGDTADDRFVGNALQAAGLNGELDGRYQVVKCDDRATAGAKGDFDREDCMVGNAVYGAGLSGHADYRYRVIASPSGRNTSTRGEGPREGNDLISACEFEPKAMERIHHDWLNAQGSPIPKLPEGQLSNVCVLIKTFLRDRHLEECVRGIKTRLPEVKMVIVDDGEESGRKIELYQQLRDEGHVCIWLPKDSGFGAKANAGIKACDRPYVLIGSDDFNFNESRQIRADIYSMMRVLEGKPEIGVASGRVDANPYEFLLEMGENWAQLKRGFYERGNVNGVEYRLCDVTVNYSLVRREVFDTVRWDDDVKIGGGEHGAFYIKVKRAGWKVALVKDVNINQMRHLKPDPRYLDFRARASSPERPCYTRIGIEHFLNPEGNCEMCAGTCMRNAQ